MSDQLMRNMEMLRLIPRNPPGISTAEIESALSVDGFKISRRSIQRDLDKLSATFPLTCDSEGNTNRWYYTLKAGQHILIPGMDHRTALTLKLAENHLKPLIPQQLKSFLDDFFPEADKILKKHPSHLKNWLNKTGTISFGLQQKAPAIDESVWDVITKAILDEQQCEVVYHSHRFDEPKTYNISPLGIVIRGPITYLLAVYDGYDDIRQMAMHRFHSARSIAYDAKIPEGFSISDYIKQGHFGILYDETPVDIEIVVQPNVAKLLREVPLGDDQVIDESESEIRVRCSLPESWDLYRWLLSHGMDIKIESPQHIKDRYIDYLKQALAQYDG